MIWKTIFVFQLKILKEQWGTAIVLIHSRCDNYMLVKRICDVLQSVYT